MSISKYNKNPKQNKNNKNSNFGMAPRKSEHAKNSKKPSPKIPYPSMAKKPRPYDKIVYLLQGGGALGSYQVGVCEGLLKSNREPNWVIGTSIGSINGAIIAGNKPEDRVKKLKEFWSIVATPLSSFLMPSDDKYVRESQNFWTTQWTILFGLPNFFSPRLMNPWFVYSSTADKLSFYDTIDLKNTLEKLIDFELINSKKVRLTLCAVNVEDGLTVNFDNFKQEIRADHILASCALPPGFPAVKIDGKYYWDGGLASNTPLSVVLEEPKTCKALCFMINLFSHHEEDPKTMFDVIKRARDLEYAGRHREIFKYFCERHRLTILINKLLEQNVEYRNNPIFQEVEKFGQTSALNIIRFHYKDRPYDMWSKDFEFSEQSMYEHYLNGKRDFEKALAKPKWFDVIDDDLLVINEV